MGYGCCERKDRLFKGSNREGDWDYVVKTPHVRGHIVMMKICCCCWSIIINIPVIFFLKKAFQTLLLTEGNKPETTRRSSLKGWTVVEQVPVQVYTNIGLETVREALQLTKWMINLYIYLLIYSYWSIQINRVRRVTLINLTASHKLLCLVLYFKKSEKSVSKYTSLLGSISI